MHVLILKLDTPKSSYEHFKAIAIGRYETPKSEVLLSTCIRTGTN